MLLEAVFRFRHATANKGIVGIQYHGIQYPIHHESICALFPKQEVTIVISHPSGTHNHRLTFTCL